MRKSYAFVAATAISSSVTGRHLNAAAQRSVPRRKIGMCCLSTVRAILSRCPHRAPRKPKPGAGARARCLAQRSYHPDRARAAHRPAPKHDLATWRVTDDWPERVPVTDAEVSITQEMGDDPMHVMMRQIMALIDEYRSKENAKHVLRALKENARQSDADTERPQSRA